MKKEIKLLMLILLIAAGTSACTGNTGTSKRDTTLTSGGDVSNKDTLLDKGKAGDTSTRTHKK